MEYLDINKILNREKYVTEIKDAINKFEINPSDFLRKAGIYVYGETGIGKTYFVDKILHELNYDVIHYDAGNIRNTGVIENIAKDKLSNKNVYHLLQNKFKKNAILMDEIDGMNNGDKGGINTLIKIIRPKKTKKQKDESSINSPIICIGNCHIDKKIKELMKVCHVIYLNVPTNTQMKQIVLQIYPNIIEEHLIYIIKFSKNNLRKLKYFIDIYKVNQDLFLKFVCDNNIQMSSYSDDTKETVKKILLHKYEINDHNIIINDTDRTSVGLLWHENIANIICNKYKNDNIKAINCYRKQLDNICLSDYIDRITFQKQIWEFNEMSSLIKSFNNNLLFHNDEIMIDKDFIGEILFTKVLTKYSTEYNNLIFINEMCQKLQMDKKDLLSFFYQLNNIFTSEIDFKTQLNYVYNVNKLETNRILRYVNLLFCKSI
jgi:hypothetical protein